jgi:CheY-like chemotaxis protein
MPDTESKNHSLLILDDDQFLLNMYALKFKNSGFAIDTANNATAALQKLRDGYSPDVILCDLIMPTVDGLEFIKRMRDERLSPASSVLVLTNTSQSADIERAKSLGVAGYIVKATATPSEVVQEVKAILSKRAK